MLTTVGKNLNWISVALNVFLILLMGTIGFVAHDIYKEIREYPNTVIKEDVETLKEKVRSKASNKDHDALCAIVDSKASKSTVERVDENIQKRLDLLVEEVRALRNDLGKYFYRMENRNRNSNNYPNPAYRGDLSWESIQRR